MGLCNRQKIVGMVAIAVFFISLTTGIVVAIAWTCDAGNLGPTLLVSLLVSSLIGSIAVLANAGILLSDEHGYELARIVGSVFVREPKQPDKTPTPTDWRNYG